MGMHFITLVTNVSCLEQTGTLRNLLNKVNDIKNEIQSYIYSAELEKKDLHVEQKHHEDSSEDASLKESIFNVFSRFNRSKKSAPKTVIHRQIDVIPLSNKNGKGPFLIKRRIIRRKFIKKDGDEKSTHNQLKGKDDNEDDLVKSGSNLLDDEESKKMSTKKNDNSKEKEVPLSTSGIIITTGSGSDDDKNST